MCVCVFVRVCVCACVCVCVLSGLLFPVVGLVHVACCVGLRAVSQALREVKALFETACCRRVAILRHFGERVPSSGPGSRCAGPQSCDYCVDPVSVTRNAELARSGALPAVKKVPTNTAGWVVAGGKGAVA